MHLSLAAPGVSAPVLFESVLFLYPVLSELYPAVFLHLPTFFLAALVLPCPDRSAPVLFESVPGHHLTGLLFRPAAQDLRLSVPQSFPAVSWLQPAAVLVLSILFLTAGSVQ